MTQYLPPNLLALFAPRDPLPYLPPVDKLPWEKKNVPYSGIAQFIQEFEDPKDTPPPTRVETRDERKERRRKERAEQVAYKLEQDLALWTPGSGPNATNDAFKTLFITRINYDTSESKLRREFEVYGPVRKLHQVINSSTGKPRGYAFIEYEHERDMHSAYKHADGKKIDGRRVLVDVERGRTIKGWRPRRLGGGLGGTRKGGPEVNTKYSGREDNFRNREDRSPSGSVRSRSRSPRRRRRSRSRERRRRSRSRHRSPRDRVIKEEDAVGSARKRSRRSRSRERRRSRSRDRERKRSRRSRSRERKPDRDRRMEEAAMQRDAQGGDDNGGDWNLMEPARIKSEPVRAGYDKYANEDDHDGDGDGDGNDGNGDDGGDYDDNGDNGEYTNDSHYNQDESMDGNDE